MTVADWRAAAEAELARRYGLPRLPDGLRRDGELAHAAGMTPEDFVARLGFRFALEDVPPRSPR